MPPTPAGQGQLRQLRVMAAGSLDDLA